MFPSGYFAPVYFAPVFFWRRGAVAAAAAFRFVRVVGAGVLRPCGAIFNRLCAAPQPVVFGKAAQ